MYIIADGEATYFEGDAVRTVEQLPVGAWSIGYRPMTNAPYFYPINDYKTSHGKIYGEAEKNANHIIEAYDAEQTKNVGVLFSGKKGLGKSLTIRLIVEKLIKERPVIIVDKYTPLLPGILSDINECVIVLDEFEKMLKSGKSEEGGMTPQESLLSVLDGTKSLSHNLYLLSANDVSSLDDNLISRPGRLRYHYRYDNISDESVIEYCKDNLIKERHSQIKDVVEAVKISSVQSLDIVQAIVKEMNTFPKMELGDIMKIMNIGEISFAINLNITFSVDGHQFTSSECWTINPGIVCRGWFNDMCYIKFKIKDVSYVPKALPLTDIIIERWDTDGIYPDVDRNDPFWTQFIDEEEDCVYLPMDKEFFAKHQIKVDSVLVSRHLDWGRY